MKNKRQNKFLGYLKFVPQTKKVVEEKKPKEKQPEMSVKEKTKVIEKKIMIPAKKTPSLLNKRIWMRFLLTLVMFGSFFWVVWLLFTNDYTLEDKFRDLLNIIIGSFLVSFGKVVDFWFKGSHDEDNKKN
jgi:hypothetical protein